MNIRRIKRLTIARHIAGSLFHSVRIINRGTLFIDGKEVGACTNFRLRPLGWIDPSSSVARDEHHRPIIFKANGSFTMTFGPVDSTNLRKALTGK